MNLAFDDKVVLATTAIKRLFDETIGQIVEDVLNDGDYDTDSLQDDLQDPDDCQIIDSIRDEAPDWSPHKEQIIFKALADIFMKNITDYHKLMAGLNTSNRDDHKEYDNKPQSILKPSKQLSDLNRNELANVVEYIIDDMHKKKDNKPHALHRHKARIIDAILLHQWDGSFDFAYNPQFELQICKQLHNIIEQNVFKQLRKAIHTFDMTLFDKIRIKQYPKATPKMPMDDIKDQGIVLGHADQQFLEIVKNAILSINKDMNASYQQIETQRVMHYFAHNITSSKFKTYSKRSFHDAIQKRQLMSRGASMKLWHKLQHLPQSLPHHPLTALNDDEFYFIVREVCKTINKEKKGKMSEINSDELVRHMKRIEFNGKQFTPAFQKQDFQTMVEKLLRKGPANTLFKCLKNCKVEKMLRLRKKETFSSIPVKDSKPRDINSLYIRYALQYVLLKFNAQFNTNKNKQIADTDGVIRFLCDVPHVVIHLRADTLHSMKTAEFAYALFDEMGVKHNPGKKVLRGVRAYDFDAIKNYSELDLNLPFIFKQCIREQKQQAHEESILLSIEGAKYCEIQDRRQLVKLLDEHQSKLSKGATFRLLNRVVERVRNGKYKSDATITPKMSGKLTDLADMEQRMDDKTGTNPEAQLMRLEQHKIFDVLSKYCDIGECMCCKEFNDIVECCVELMDRHDTVEIMKALNEKLTQINSVGDCDNELLIVVLNDCMDRLIESGIIKDRPTARERIMNYIKESNLNGEDIHSKLTKKAKFAIHIFRGAGFTAKDKGIKTELMKVHTEMNDNFDFTKLSSSSQMEMNGALFVKHFESAQSFVKYMYVRRQMNDESKQEWADLYEGIGSFFKPIEERNEKEFNHLLHLFMHYKYGMDSKPSQLQLNGDAFVNKNRDVFSKMLNEGNEYGLRIYDDVMEVNVRSKGIKTLQQCTTRNECIHVMRRYVIPMFNGINNDIVCEYLERNMQINIATYFNRQNRKSVANELKKQYQQQIKIGPIRKLCCNIHSCSF